jgi:hypothetical protein
MAILMACLVASPSSADDRQLLQANAGANANVLVILDSSHSMDDDFSGAFRMPAYMDDFFYPQGTHAAGDPIAFGSKLGLAKSVLREVITKTAGVNWALTYYRNPNQTYGAQVSNLPGFPGIAVGGARNAGQFMENGGMEWMYFADETYPGGLNIDTEFDPDEWPDVQQGRFLQLGHKVHRNFNREDTGELADMRYP